MSRRTRRVTRLLLGAVLLLPSSAWQSAQAEAQPTGQQTTAAIPLDGAVMGGGLVMQAHAETLRPAPLPNPDVSAPGPSNDALASQADPSLSPDLFNPQSHFAGDGYAPGSSIETDHIHRHSTGGGMSLSIPMQ
jgi:hypothetical protein